VKGRVAHILIFLSNKIYKKKSFRMPITRREVGELISMTTENTIRTFSEFKKDGIISIEGKVVTIQDYDRLLNVSKTG
jgi:CRP/FNR family transcriptional regulator